jgi:hypothetical protein
VSPKRISDSNQNDEASVVGGHKPTEKGDTRSKSAGRAEWVTARKQCTRGELPLCDVAFEFVLLASCARFSPGPSLSGGGRACTGYEVIRTSAAVATASCLPRTKTGTQVSFISSRPRARPLPRLTAVAHVLCCG